MTETIDWIRGATPLPIYIVTDRNRLYLDHPAVTAKSLCSSCDRVDGSQCSHYVFQEAAPTFKFPALSLPPHRNENSITYRTDGNNMPVNHKHFVGYLIPIPYGLSFWGNPAKTAFRRACSDSIGGYKRDYCNPCLEWEILAGETGKWKA